MSPAPVIIIPTAVIVQRNRIIRHFNKAAAHTPESAQTLETLSITRNHIFSRMIKGGVIKEETGGRFWFDEAAEKAAGARRLRMVLTAVIAALVSVGVMAAVAALVR